MPTAVLEAQPRKSRRSIFAGVAAAAAIAVSSLVNVPQAHAADPDVFIWLDSAAGGAVLFELTDFTPQANEDIRIDVVRTGESFARSSDVFTVDSAGGVFDALAVPANAPIGSNYTLRVYDDTGFFLASSSNFNVYASTLRVTNPGDHQDGIEKTSVQQGGVWTFNGTKFAANGKLRATATIGGNTVDLVGVGQSVDATGPYWQLNSSGNTTEITRVKIADPATGAVPATGSLSVTFSDGVNSITRTLNVLAAPAATASVTYNAATNELTLTGSGWAHPTDAAGSVVAIKIDEGAWSRVGTDYAVNPANNTNVTNKTVWWVVQADASGAINATFPAPTGLTSGVNATTVPFASGSHTLRLLSGNLYPTGGDASRTFETNAFTY